MELHEFFREYANVPLEKRGIVIDFNEAGLTNLDDIYQELKKLDDEMRPKRIRQEELLKLAEKVLNN